MDVSACTDLATCSGNLHWIDGETFDSADLPSGLQVTAVDGNGDKPAPFRLLTIEWPNESITLLESFFSLGGIGTNRGMLQAAAGSNKYQYICEIEC